jgi:hypothetical protein
MSQAKRQKQTEMSMQSDDEAKRIDEVRRRGLPAFLLRLREDAGEDVAKARWAPRHRHD